jgi:hypothetical protein
MTIGPEPMISILCMSLRFGTVVFPSIVQESEGIGAVIYSKNYCLSNIILKLLAKPRPAGRSPQRLVP